MKHSNFSDLVARVSYWGNADPVALVELSKAVAVSVLNKVIDPQRRNRSTDPEYVSNNGCNPFLFKMRNEILNGDQYGDGNDLVNAATVAILEQREQFKRLVSVEPEQFPNWLEFPFEKTELSRRVYIKDGATQTRTIETTPIQQVFRAVRRAIMSSRAVQSDPRNGYLYIEQMATDPETGDPVELYRRLPKYADLGGYATGINGTTDYSSSYTATAETLERYDQTIARLNLTDRQAEILKYRLQGYGYKAIATRLGVTEQAVLNACKRMRAKYADAVQAEQA